MRFRSTATCLAARRKFREEESGEYVIEIVDVIRTRKSRSPDWLSPTRRRDWSFPTKSWTSRCECVGSCGSQWLLSPRRTTSVVGCIFEAVYAVWSSSINDSEKQQSWWITFPAPSSIQSRCTDTKKQRHRFVPLVSLYGWCQILFSERLVMRVRIVDYIEKPIHFITCLFIDNISTDLRHSYG